MVLPSWMILFTTTFDIRLIGGVIESSVKSASNRHSPPRSTTLTTYIKRGSFDVMSAKWRVTAADNLITAAHSGQVFPDTRFGFSFLIHWIRNHINTNDSQIHANSNVQTIVYQKNT